MLAAMIAVIPPHATATFNSEFYVVAATIIPLLFVALAVEGRFIQDLLSAFERAGKAWVAVGRWQEFLAELTQRRHTERTARIILGLTAAAVGVLAVGIAICATASEILAILGLYHQAAAPWMGTFVLSGTILLTVVVGAGPAIAIVRFVGTAIRAERKRLRELAQAVAASAAGQSGSQEDSTVAGTADSGTDRTKPTPS